MKNKIIKLFCFLGIHLYRGRLYSLTLNKQTQVFTVYCKDCHEIVSESRTKSYKCR